VPLLSTIGQPPMSRRFVRLGTVTKGDGSSESISCWRALDWRGLELEAIGNTTSFLRAEESNRIGRRDSHKRNYSITDIRLFIAADGQLKNHVTCSMDKSEMPPRNRGRGYRIS